jgi:hypothetical protein
VSVDVTALAGTKIKANAAMSANRRYEQIAREILAEAAAADADDDECFSDRRGDELPSELADPASRWRRLRAAKQRLEAEVADSHAAHEARLRGRAELEAPARRQAARPQAQGTAGGFLQGDNAQAVCTDAQIVLAADVFTDSPDGRLLAPMLDAARRELAAIGIEQPPGVVLADGGYWNVPDIEQAVAAGSEVLVNPDSGARPACAADERKLRDKRVHGLYAHMQRAITSSRGVALYRRRNQVIERSSPTPGSSAAPTASNARARQPAAPNGD